MGALLYDGTRIGFDDRLLEHLQIVIVQRLRLGDRFAMSWRDPSDLGEGRSSIWLHPEVDLYFKFDGARMPAIDPAWLRLLTASAVSPRGLVVVDEDGTLVRANQPADPLEP
jgi:hypothetical protein